MPTTARGYVLENYHGESALQRFDIVVEMVSGDDVAVSLLEKLLSSAERYFGKVFEMETRLKLARQRLEGDALRELTENLDGNRRYAHDALVSDLHIFNRYILRQFQGEVPVGGIFSFPPEAIRDRAAVGDWAGELLSAVYASRRR